MDWQQKECKPLHTNMISYNNNNNVHKGLISCMIYDWCECVFMLKH